MPGAVKTYSHNVYSHYKSDFHRQREVKNHNLLSACLSAIANVPKNISISKTLQKTCNLNQLKRKISTTSFLLFR